TTLYANGLNVPNGLAFDTQGNLYVANYGNGTVSKVDPADDPPSTFVSGLSGPVGLAFDGKGNLYVSDFDSNSLSRLSLGSVIVQPSLPSLPMTIGGMANAGTGINLTNAELARLNADNFTFGSPTQTGNITFTTATLVVPAGGSVVVLQNPNVGGQVVLDDG